MHDRPATTPETTTTTTDSSAPSPVAMPGPPLVAPSPRRRSDRGEDGSLVSEYGLLAVLGATIAGVAISWAQGGAIASLLDAILQRVHGLAGV